MDVIRGSKASKVIMLVKRETLRYFNCSYFDIGNQEILVSRTGWTGEVGVEIYGRDNIGDRPFGIMGCYI